MRTDPLRTDPLRTDRDSLLASMERTAILPRLVAAGAFTVPALSLALPSGYSWGALLLVIAGVLYLRRGLTLPCDATFRAFVAAVLAMALVRLVRVDVDWAGTIASSDFDRTVKYGLALVAWIAVARYAPPSKWLQHGCWTGSWLAGLTAAWQWHGLGWERASGYTNAIQFGDIALLLAGWSALWWRHATTAFGRIWGAGAVVAGLYASIAAGARGAWIVAPVLLAWIAWVDLRYGPLGGSGNSLGKSRWRPAVATLATGFMLIATVLAAHREYIGERMALAWQEWARFQAASESETSVGHRLAHWRLAWTMGLRRPWVGWSEAGYSAEKQRLVDTGAAPAVVLRFGHAHQEWLDLWAKAGLWGVTTLAVFYAVPLVIYGRALRRLRSEPSGWARDKAVTIAACGVMTVVGFVGFGMTQVLFAHNSGHMMYLFMNILWLGALRSVTHETATPRAAPRVPERPDPHALAANAGRRLRVLHFVTGGFSGVTQVALDLCQTDGRQETLLVLRRRSHDISARVAELRARGLAVETVPQQPHAYTVWRLWQICRTWRPDILVAHGFSNHLWGRYAGWLAGVPHLVHVEHNVRERYTWWRLCQSIWLARRTDAIVAVSDAVRLALIRLGHPADRCVTIYNGIDTQHWNKGLPWEIRESAVVMAARFSRQKDHETLIRAARLLLDRGTPIVIYLAGGGSRLWRLRAQRLVERLGITSWVRFLGRTSTLPDWYGRVRYCVLSTHYEGLPLSLLEGMASGCCAIGSAVEGVREIIDHGQTGLLVPPRDPEALAHALAGLLAAPHEGQRLANAGQRLVRARFDRRLMLQRYADLFNGLAGNPFDGTASPDGSTAS